MIALTSLGSRLILWYVLMITGTVTAVFLTGRLLLQAELLHGIDLLNATEFQDIKDRVQKDNALGPESDFLEKISDHSKLDAPLYCFQVRDSSGNLLFRSLNMGKAVFPENPDGSFNWTCPIDKLGDMRISLFQLGGYEVQIASSVRAVHRLFTYYYQVCALLLAAVAALSFFFGHQMSLLALNPIRRIQQAARRISAENLKERIPVSGVRDEISDLTALLNQMFDRLEKAFGRLSRFAGEASHELKTPLSIIRLQSEKLIRQGNLSGVQQEAVQQQLESIQGLNQVIEKLLFIARSEVGDIRPQLKRQSTRSFIDAFVEDALVLCEDRGISLAVTQNDDVATKFDGPLLRQVLLNLLSNAIKVTPAGAGITLSSSTQSSVWRVMVEDTGPGLADSLGGEEMFKPFVRLDPKRDWSFAGGAGLGLAICRSILDLHQGTIRAENRKPVRGLRIIFELPLTLG